MHMHGIGLCLVNKTSIQPEIDEPKLVYWKLGLMVNKIRKGWAIPPISPLLGSWKRGFEGRVGNHNGWLKDERKGRSKLHHHGCYPHCLPGPWTFFFIILRYVLTRQGQKEGPRWHHHLYQLNLKHHTLTPMCPFLCNLISFLSSLSLSLSSFCLLRVWLSCPRLAMLLLACEQKQAAKPVP